MLTPQPLDAVGTSELSAVPVFQKPGALSSTASSGVAAVSRLCMLDNKDVHC